MKHRHIERLLPAIWGLFIAAGVLFSAPPAGAETWKCYSYMPSPTHVVFVGLQDIAKAIEKISEGKITVTCNVGGSLPIKSDSIAQAVSDGVLNVATSGFDTGYVPVLGLFSVPGLFASEAELDKGYEAVRPILEAELAKRNIVLLGAYHYPRQVIWSTSEVRSLDDLKGLKMRANSPENSEFIKRFGGIPITMATPEVASALQRGVFPAVITAAAGAGQLWVEMLRFMLDVGPSYTVSFVLVGKPSFDKLTPDQQKALRTAVSEETAGVSGKMRKQNDELLAKFVTGGFKIAPGSAAQEKQVVDTMRPYWTEWAKQRGDAASTALKTAQQALGK